MAVALVLVLVCTLSCVLATTVILLVATTMKNVKQKNVVNVVVMQKNFNVFVKQKNVVNVVVMQKNFNVFVKQGEPRLCGGVIVIRPASARPSASAPSSSDGRFTGHGVPHYSSSSSSSSGVHCRYYNGIEGSCSYGSWCRYIHDSERKCNCTRDNCHLSH